MPTEVTARHMHAADKIQDYAKRKAKRMLEAFPRIERIHVILNIEKYRNIAEVVVQARSHIRIEAEESSNKMRTSIDSAVEKIEKQLRKLRHKVQDHKSVMKHVAMERIKGVDS